jgi:hypothetical protein
MRRLAAIVVVLLGLAPFFAVGCDQTELNDLARKVIFDLRSVAFTAQRHFVADFDGAIVDWLEEVQSAGDGEAITVRLLERNGFARNEITDPVELAAFDRLAGLLSAGGGPRALFQRDPAPDDLDRLIANYYVTVIQITRETMLRGETSLTYRLDPIAGDRPFYVLTVSTRAGHEGFPIECQEYVQDATGPRLVSDMRVTALDWNAPKRVDPPPSPILSRLALTSLDEAKSRAAVRGLSLYLPKDTSLPSGFVLVSADEIDYLTDANPSRTPKSVTLYRFVYSDGIERIDFVEHSPGDLPPNLLQGFAGRGEDLALVTRFGSINVASLLHGGTLITIESRIAADRFDAMLAALVQL